MGMQLSTRTQSSINKPTISYGARTSGLTEGATKSSSQLLNSINLFIPKYLKNPVSNSDHYLVLSHMLNKITLLSCGVISILTTSHTKFHFNFQLHWKGKTLISMKRFMFFRVHSLFNSFHQFYWPTLISWTYQALRSLTLYQRELFKFWQ